ncbi:MAG: BspA family leucine-rich repeat surface protein [Prevotella sp.]|nr:BspA family leucine-rich repeat surface protein [Prevotella sp.]
MKKLLFMMFVLLIPFMGWAQERSPFIVYDGSGKVTFMYDQIDAEKLQTVFFGSHVSLGWDLNSCTFYPDAIDFRKSDVTRVEFQIFCSSYKSTDLSGFFEGMSNLIEIAELKRLNTREATNMSRMFAGCSSLTSLDLTYNAFDTSKATDLSGMFDGCSQLTTIYCDDTWAEGHPDVFKGCVNLRGGDGTTYSADKISSSYAHPNEGGYFTNTSDTYIGPYVTFSESSGTVTFYYGELTDEVSQSYFNQGVTNIIYPWVLYDYKDNITKAIFDASCSNYYPTDLSYLFSECETLKEISGIQYLNTSNVTNMTGMFSGCSSLTILDVSNFNTSNVTDMSSMFYDCPNLSTLDVSNFNTGKVENMNFMFYGCSGLTSLDVSHFNTENVTSMEILFGECSSLTSLDISNFNTSKVTDMAYMFYGCSGITSLDVSHFDTGKVNTMSLLFCGCSSLTNLDVSHFNTSSVIEMDEMFEGCSKLTKLDLNGFNTSNVTNMWGMFYECNGLTSLDVINFSIGIDTDLAYMFYGCSNLTTIYCNDTWPTGYEKMFEGCESIKGGDGTTYSSANTSSDYAHPNSGGYFTAKHTTFSTVVIGTKTQFWSSFYTTTRNVRADNSTTVYTATLSSDGKELTLNEIADRIIPCGQAVLMKSTTKDPVFQTSSSEGTGDYSTNSLQGTQVDIPTSSIEGTVYTLASESGNFGFFRYTGETLKAGKAFLVVPGGAAARITIVGLDEATGIQSVSDEAQQKSYYDLQGRRVNAPQKGIYIINRQKVIK